MVREESSFGDTMIDRNWVTKRKRKRIKPASNFTNGKEAPALSSGSTRNSSSLKKLKCDKDIPGFSHKIRGEDGYFYECVECDLGGNLLCCDSCPRTYHLECLNPPLKRAPPGKWYCPKCREKKEDHGKDLGSLEGTLRRSRTSGVHEKPTVSNNKLGDKVTLLSRKDHIKGNKGKNIVSRRASFGKTLDSLEVNKSSSSVSSPSSDRDTREASSSGTESRSDNKTNENFEEEKKRDSSSNASSRKIVQTGFKMLNSVSNGKSPLKKAHQPKTEEGVTSILQSSKKSSKIKKKNKGTDKKSSKAEKGKTSATCDMDEPSFGTPSHTSGSLKKRKSLGQDNAASKKDAKALKSASRELSKITPERTSSSSQGLEDGVQRYNSSNIQESASTTVQQVDRILGCRLQANDLINKTIKSAESPQNPEPGSKAKEPPSYNLDISDKNGKLPMEGHAGMKDCEAEMGGCNSEGGKVGEEKEDTVALDKQENDKKYDAKEDVGTLETVLSEKESAVDEPVMEKSCTLLTNNSDNECDEAEKQSSKDIVNHNPVRKGSSPDVGKVLSVPRDSEGMDLENIGSHPDDNVKTGTISETTEDLATKNKEGIEYEFLVKWAGQSNIHNSWVSESILKEIAKRKLENYKAKYGTTLINICEEQWMQPQRVIAQRISKDGVVEVFVKWYGLPYDECSWESLDEPVLKQSAHLIEELKQFESQTMGRGARNEPQQRIRNAQDFIPLVEQPKELKGGSLFPHQLEALNWLRKSWLKCRNVILADEMGLGKTVSACAFISSLCCEFKVNLPCLVLVPLSTIPNWSAEFGSWAPHLNVVEYHGCAKARSIIRQYEWHASSQNRSAKHSNTYKFNVLLTTYEMVLADSSYLRGVPWEVLIVDEGHRLKNSGSKLFSLLNTFSFQHRVLLTGTPLQNNIGEMYNLLNFLQPESFPSLSTFEEKFNDLTTAEKVDELKKLVAPHMLRRLKKDAMQSIPPKTERMVPVELTSIQAEYYRAMLTKNYQILRNTGKGGAMQSMLNIVMQLRKVCNHPYLIPGTEPDSGSAEFLHEMRIKASAKLTLLHAMLKYLHKEGHRVLIFSQMTKLLDILEDYLAVEYGPKAFERVDGSVSVADRQIAITRFNQDKSRFVFLLSTRSCGLGINLATADTVIIYDSDFNPHADIQAMNRAHRIGQSNRLLVYRLVVRASVEERILQLAKKKLMLDQLFVNKSGSQKEVEDILRWGTEELFNDSTDLNGQDAKASAADKAEAVGDGEQKQRRRLGGLGDVYQDKCTEGSPKIIWDENAILKLLDRSNLQSFSEAAEMENDMLGSVKSVEWNDESNEEPGGTVVLSNGVGEGSKQTSEGKEDNAPNPIEENEWDKLLRIRWETYQIEEEASLGRGKRLRKAVSYKENFASVPSEVISESDKEDEEPVHEYTPAGRAFKEKFAKLRARQKERIAQRQMMIDIPHPIDRSEIPLPLVASDFETEGGSNKHPEENHDLAISIYDKDDKVSQQLDAVNKNQSSAKFRKSSKHGYKGFNNDNLDLSSSPSDFFSQSRQNETTGSGSGPCSNKSPVLGLYAPNAEQAGASSRNSRPHLKSQFSNSESKRKINFNTEHPVPPACTPVPSENMNAEGRLKLFNTSLFPETSGESSHQRLKSTFPDGYFPFRPPAATYGRSLDAPENSGSSFTSFQEKLGLPKLFPDDQPVPKFSLPPGPLMKPREDFLPNLTLGTNVEYMNCGIQDSTNASVFPNMRQQLHDSLMQKHQVPDLSPMLGLGPMQSTHSPLPENHKKVLDNIMIRTQSSANKFFKKKFKADLWSEDELDSLWIGVRRHGRGSWDAMLKDPKLKFAKHRTAEDLMARWTEEQRKIIDIPPFSAPKVSKPPSFPGISDEMMNRALFRSKFTSLGLEPQQFRSQHLTDIQLGSGTSAPSFPSMEPFNKMSRLSENSSHVGMPNSDMFGSSFKADFYAGPFDRPEKFDFPLELPMQSNIAPGTFAHQNSSFLSSSSLQKNSNVNNMNKNIHLPRFPDRLLNPLHGSHSIHTNDSTPVPPLDFQKRPVLPHAADVSSGGLKTNLPHWLRDAVKVPPSRPPEDELPATLLPPNVSAIAESVRLIYGEKKTIPPFAIPGPLSQPKDPRKRLKKKRKIHNNHQLTPHFGHSTRNFDHEASSSVPPIITSSPADMSKTDLNESLPSAKLNLKSLPSSPVSPSTAAQGQNYASTEVPSHQIDSLAGSSMSSGLHASPVAVLPGPGSQRPKLVEPNDAELLEQTTEGCHIQDFRRSEKEIVDLEEATTEEAVSDDQIGSQH